MRGDFELRPAHDPSIEYKALVQRREVQNKPLSSTKT